MALSTRSRLAVPVIGALMSVGGLVGPAVAAPPSTTACPSEAVGMFLAHFNSNHLSKSLAGVGDAVSDPAGWVGAHETLISAMASKATGTCGGDSGGSSGGGYKP